jgi:hypothetical protein
MRAAFDVDENYQEFTTEDTEIIARQSRNQKVVF